MRKPIVLLGLVLLAILGVMVAKSYLIRLPEVRPASAEGFSAERAAARLARILGDERPHPTDTAANDAVRERIVAELRSMGLQPRVRDQAACNELMKARGVTCARVRNIVATIGPAEGKHLLISAHYDSSVAGPGAGDAGVGVASLLEVASIIKDRPLRRPVTFLFNEGEELGLVGAQAFLADPLSRRVDSLINLEARGVTGPANMFETSRPNAPAIAAFARAVDRPVANSLSVDVYRLMPNYTDVNTFEERGWTTLNLAIIGNETRYHSAGDNLAALDRQSLQHMGDQALALAAELANGVPRASGERIFMDIAGRVLVTLPLVAGLVLLAGLVLGWGIAAWSARGLGRGLIAVVGALLLSALLGWAGEALMALIRAGMFWRAQPVWMHLTLYASAMLAGLAALTTIARRAPPRGLRAAFWLVFVLIGVLIALIAPGGIIYFLFPPLLALLGLALRRVWAPAEPAGAWAAIGLLYLTWGAMLGLLEELLNQGPMWVFAPLGLLLVLPVLIEAKPLIDRAGRRAAVGLGALLVLAGWGAVVAAPAYSADRQQMFTVEHVTDAAAGKAYWSILNDFAPLPEGVEQLADWRLDALPNSKRERWLAPAPRIPGLEPPAVEIIGRSAADGARTVRVRLDPNGAESIVLLAPEDAQIRAAGTAGFVRPADQADDGQYVLRCFGRSCEKLVMEVIIGKAEPVELVLVGSRRTLPPSAATLLEARPRLARPQYAPDATLVLSRATL